MIDLLRAHLDANPSKAELARLALLEAAIEEFGLRGVEGARTRAIAEKAQQNLGSIAYYFKNKEGLYYAVAETTTGMMRTLMQPVFEQADALIAREAEQPLSFDDCLQMVLKLVEPMMQALLGSERMAALSLIIMREQMRPTQIFDLYYERLVRPLHTYLTHFLARCAGDDPTSAQAMARAHAIVGQVLIFRNAQAALCRRTGWASIDGAQREIVYASIRASVEATMRGFDAHSSPRSQS
ncbi:MAG: ybiH [Puniceicoccaceae bacterium 5H]|nr:MAG: ybiH [Puniceicoccaceae bacterium 5H]